jgi:hypothetical protein
LPGPSQIPTALKFAGLLKDCPRGLSITLKLIKSIFLYLKNLSWVALIKELLVGLEII